MTFSLRLIATALLPLAMTMCLALTAGADDEAFFFERVLPIFQQHCYDCHSHDGGVMEGGLALDWRSGWSEGGDRGPAIVPGDPDNSILIQAIRHTDAELVMPEEKLSDEEIAILVQWVQSGAHDPRVAKPQLEAGEAPKDWWSLQPLVRPPLPQQHDATDSSTSLNPIDMFVAARLQEANLRPSPPADKRTLLRRVMMDLHGLHPTLEQVAAFESDQEPGVWERLVDELLQSPRYGERWARHWLDTIHFADSHGFEHDVFRPHAWHFRDYVIDAFNEDLPWDEFIRQQLASDYYYPDQSTLRVALGFLGAGPYDQSAAATAPMSFEYLDRDDLVTQVMGAFQSTTANCARCHAHKFDPITQEDYFALQAVFAGVTKGDIAYDSDAEIANQRRHWSQLLTDAKSGLAEVLMSESNRQLVRDWEQAEPVVWTAFQPDTFVSTGGATLTRLEDHSVLSSGMRPDVDAVVVAGITSLQTVTAIRLEVLTDPSLPMQGPGRQDNGNLHLNEFVLETFPPGATSPQRIPFRTASADFNQEGWHILHAIDGNLATAWGIYPSVGKGHEAVFELESPLVLEPGTRLSMTLRQNLGGGHLIGRLRLSLTSGPPQAAIALPENVAKILQTKAAERTAEDQLVLQAAILEHLSNMNLRALPPEDKVYAAGAVAENERGMLRIDVPREIHVLTRGDLEKPKQKVAPGALSILDHLPSRFVELTTGDERARRAALAEWIADPENPLTWRSIANRVWHYHFGRGIVDTPSDFGRMGSMPSHPMLLDWLACELRDNNGSLKHLHRLICTSRTYQQSSLLNDELYEADPDNRLLARFTRRKLDAESFRDSLLVLSGSLDLTMYGPGIKNFSESPGPQVTPVLDYKNYDLDSGGSARRSIYRVVWRGIPDPLMEALDFPDLGLLAPKRNVSASPLQALALLNNRFVLHHAERMADRHANDSNDHRAAIREIVQRVYLREPHAEEVEALSTLADRHGIESVCRMLFNSNEFLFLN